MNISEKKNKTHSDNFFKFKLLKPYKANSLFILPHTSECWHFPIKYLNTGNELKITEFQKIQIDIGSSIFPRSPDLSPYRKKNAPSRIILPVLKINIKELEPLSPYSQLGKTSNRWSEKNLYIKILKKICEELRQKELELSQKQGKVSKWHKRKDHIHYPNNKY